MNAEHAWQSVLGQLQMEMPRASFDTWVRDTKPVSYDAGIMTVAVRNAYARDWLDSRLMPETPAMLAALDVGIRSLETEPTVPAEEVRRKIKAWATG